MIIGSNNLAVALALGALGQAERRLRVMLVFGLFEFFVPLVGIWLGSATAEAIGLQTNVVGAVLLVGLGLSAVIVGLRDQKADEELARRVTEWRGLLFLAACLSVDNLAVGFGLGLGRANPLAVATAIAFFSVLFTWAGMRLGRDSRHGWERGAKIVAGALLVGLGLAGGAGWF
ncbi:manganese efflux pump [Methanotrichaceae archaeon Mx]|uniref:Manganese efflux pump n=1 Tax=Candidatus Methanocrinis natronophilus TaxID=3033396 RepID=A0ABT5XAW8_9EURY|nr:manganese efflux pump [Candidatus Methanocrinis natronophilus]